jgi:hypothetical protein
LTLRGYARHRGCSHEAVRRAIAAGRIEAGKDGRIDPATADKQWRERTATSNGAPLAAARRRLIAAQARRAELRARKEAGELLEAHDVERVWSGHVARARTMLLAWSATLADKVHRAAVLEDVGAVERLLEREVRRVLQQLADDRDELPPDDNNNDEETTP